jgi:hypothetical protein
MTPCVQARAQRRAVQGAEGELLKPPLPRLKCQCRCLVGVGVVILSRRGDNG